MRFQRTGWTATVVALAAVAAIFALAPACRAQDTEAASTAESAAPADPNAPVGMGGVAQPGAGTVITPTREAPADEPGKVTDTEKQKDIIKALPHIVINRKDKTVTVDGDICLRDGFLELFACGNGIREHEAIVSLAARPLNINVALILLNLTPGNPVTWTEKGEVLPPAGPVIQVFVEHQKDGKTVRVPANEWLVDSATGKMAPPQKWVFCGGQSRDGHFAADFEGTVVCLSNFPSAILDMPYESTSKNADLLFKARTEAIPPLLTCAKCGNMFDAPERLSRKVKDPESGEERDEWYSVCPKCKTEEIMRTPVKVVFQVTGNVVEGKRVLWSFVINRDGSMTLNEKPSSLEDLDAKLQRKDEYVRTVQVQVDPDSPVKLSLQAMRTITKYGLEPQLIEQKPIEPVGSGEIVPPMPGPTSPAGDPKNDPANQGNEAVFGPKSSEKGDD